MRTPAENANVGLRFSAYTESLTLNKNTEIKNIALSNLATWTNDDDVNCIVTM
jgi:hypothetical protein